MYFMICGKYRNRSPKPEYQFIKKSDGVIRIDRVKSSRSARRDTSRLALVPSSDEEAQPAQLIVPHSQSPSNPQAQSYTRSRLNKGAKRQPLQQRRRSTPLYIQAVQGQDQEQVIQRQQHQRRASAPHASSDWTLDQETALIELMRDELNIEDAADALDRTVEDVTQRWAGIKNENKEAERIGHERQRARQDLHNRGQLNNPPVTNQAPLAASATAPAVAPAVAPMFSCPVAPADAPTFARAVAPAVPRAFAHAAAPAAPKQRIFLLPSRKPANHNAVPVDAAPETVPTNARLRGRRWAYVEDIEDGYEEPERRGRELHRDREQFQGLRQPMIPTVTGQAPSAAPAAAHAAQQQKGGSVQSPSRKLANCNPVMGYAANQAPWAAPAAALAAQQQKGGFVQPTSRKPANRNLVTGYAAPKPVPEKTFLKRQRSPPTTYRLLDSERQGYASGSASARLRPTHRYRSPTPQGRKDREQSTVEQTNKPAVVQAPNQETFGVPGYAPEPLRRVWTKRHYGWESRVIKRID